MTITTRAVFERLGLAPDWSAMTDQPPGYTIQFGTLSAQATEVTGAPMGRMFLIAGAQITARTALSISYGMPLAVESFDQGLAYLAYALRHRAEPQHDPEWLTQGLALHHLLPWERQHAAYAARPVCTVERDWFRLAARDLTRHASEASTNHPIEVGFDGAILVFDLHPGKIAMPAQGTCWPQSYATPIKGLLALPRRLNRNPVIINVWHSRLSLDCLSLPVEE